MSRPVVIAFFALIAGVVLADFLLYDALWLGVPSRRSDWVVTAPWMASVLLTVVAWFCYRAEEHSSIFSQRTWFPLLTFVFFLVLGFGRYALAAERQHQAWAVEGRPVNPGNPDEFDYVRWCWVKGSQTRSNHGDRTEIGRRLLRRMSALGMEEKTRAVVAAMTLGDRSLLTRDTRELFADAGASHLLALSGLHLGIIVGLFLQLMNGRFLCSRWRYVLGVSVLMFAWMYAWLTGMPTSLVRAATMTSLFICASLLNRYGDPLQHLLLTGIILLLVRPMYLFDVGAQLSFLSVAGILLFYRPLYMWFFDRWRYQIFWLERYWLLWPFTTFAVSLCAQLLTFPLVAFYFHQIPVYGAVLSIVLIPLTTLFIALAFTVLVLSVLWPAAASLLSVPLSWIVYAMMWMMTSVSHWPGAVVKDFWSRKAEPQLVIYNRRSCPALHLIASPSQSWLLMPEPAKADSGLYYIRRDFWQRRLTAKPRLLRGSRGFVMGRLRVVMVNHRVGENAFSADRKAEKTDVVWITRGFKGGRLGCLTALYVPRLLVLDASLPRWQRRALAHEAWRAHWHVYDVAVQGALRVGLSRELLQ